jgi:hypothetical protein
MTAPSAAYDACQALAELEKFLPPFATLVPLAPRGKKPSVDDWTSLLAQDRTKHEFRLLFAGDSGIGLLCGDASGGICMVDVDRDCLVDAAEDVAPELHGAPRVHGARGAKWLVRATETTRGFALRDGAGCRIGEFLGERQQGVVAGLHPDGENIYRWHRKGEIPVVNPRTLAESFCNIPSPP